MLLDFSACKGRLAQSARALRSHRRGQQFEPVIAHQYSPGTDLVSGLGLLRVPGTHGRLMAMRRSANRLDLG